MPKNPPNTTPKEVKVFQQKLKDEGLYKGNIDGIYGPLTEKAHIEHNTRMSESDMMSPFINALGYIGRTAGQYTGVPLNIRQLGADVMGATPSITENDLTQKELDALRGIVRSNLAKGKTTIGYDDYKTGNDVGGKNISPMTLLGKLDDPNYNLKTTLGQAEIHINNGDTTVTDRYNFNDQGIVTPFDAAKNVINNPDPYRIMRNIGSVFGSGVGQGSKVNIKTNAYVPPQISWDGYEDGGMMNLEGYQNGGIMNFEDGGLANTGTPQINEATQIANLRSKGVSENAINFFMEKQRSGWKPNVTSDNPTFNDQHIQGQVSTPYSETQGAGPDFVKSVYNAAIPEGLVKSIWEVPNIIAGIMGTDALTQATDQGIKWIDENLEAYVSPQFSKGMLKLDDHGDLAFNDARSIMNGLGQGVGSFLSMMLPAAAGTKYLGMGNKMATMVGATLTTIPALYQGGKDAGLTNQQNAMMVGILAPIVGALENVGGMEAQMLRKAMGKEAADEVVRLGERGLAKALGKLGVKGASVTAEDFKIAAKESLDGLRPLLGRVLNKNAGKNAWGEFEEEYLQNIVQAGGEQIFDTFFNNGGKAGQGKYHNPEDEILIDEGQGITGGAASLSPVDWIAKGMDMRYNKQVFKDDLGAAIYGAIIGHGLTAITTPIVNQSLYGYIQTASDKAGRGTPRNYGQMGQQAGGQQAVQALGAITQKMFQSGKIDQAQAQQIMQTVQQMSETAHNLSGIKDMTPAVSYDAYNAQYNLRPAMQQQVAGYEQAMAQVAQMTQATDQSGQPIIGPAEAPDLIKLADAQKKLAEGYDDYMRSKDMLKAIHEHINHIVQGDFKDGKVDGGNIMEVAKRIAKNKYDITKNPDMKGPMAGYTPKAQKKAQKPAPAVTVSQLVGVPITMNGVAGTVAKDEKGVYVFHPEGEAAVVPIGDKDVPAQDLGIVHDENIKPVKPKKDAIQKPSTEKKVSPVGEGGENIPQDGGGMGQGEQGDEVAGADNAQKPAEIPAEEPQVEIVAPSVEIVAPKVEVVRDAEHDKNVLQKAVKELLPARDIEITDELLAELMKEDGSINRSALMRKLKIGYNKAGDIANKFESDRLIPPAAKEIIEENKEEAKVVEGSKDAIINSLDTDKYIYVTHQTDEVGLQRILKEGFNIQQGLNGTTLFGNKESIASQIDDILNGAGHRGSTQMIIFAFPKSEFKKAKLQLDDISDAYIDKGIFALPASTIHAVFNGKINQEHENDINNNANDLLNNEQNAEEVEIILNAGLPLELEGELGARQGEGVDNGAGSGGIGEGGEQGDGKDKPNVNEKGVAEQVPNAEDNAPANEVGEYAYHLTLRPFGIGTYPDENFVRWEDDGTKFGKIIYSKPVPIKDISHFSLNAITEAEQLDGKTVTVRGTPYEWKLELKKNEKREGRYYFEAVQFDEDGTEVDREQMTTEEVIRNVQEGRWKIKEKTAKPAPAPEPAKKKVKLKRDYNGEKAGAEGEVVSRPNMFVTDVKFPSGKTHRIDNTYLEKVVPPAPKPKLSEFKLSDGSTIQAEVVDIPGLEHLDTAIGQQGMEFIAFEIATGLQLGDGFTKEDALASAKRDIVDKGQAGRLTHEGIHTKISQGGFSFREVSNNPMRQVNPAPKYEKWLAEKKATREALPLLYNEDEIKRLEKLIAFYREKGDEYTVKMFEFQADRRVGEGGAHRINFEFNEAKIQPDYKPDPVIYTGKEEEEGDRMTPEEKKKRALTRAKNEYEKKKKEVENSSNIFKKDLLEELEVAYNERVAVLTERYDAQARALDNKITPAQSTIPAPSNTKAKWENARKEGKYTEDTVEHTRNEPLANVVLGAEGTSNFSAGPEAQNVPFRYALVTLDEVEPTHKGVRENPENFIMEGQPKADVSKEALSARDVQNQTFAKEFNNTQQGPSGASPYNGFSNVNQRGEVFQGTGRWNILNHYYNTHAGSYEARIEYLKSIAAQLGLTGEQIDEFVKKNEGKKVDVVKMYNVTDEQAIRLGQYDQKDAEAKVQGAAENQMAAKITPSVLAKIRSIIANAVTGDSRGLQILQAKAKAMIDALVADGVITAGEYQGYFDANGNPQVSAITAIQDILLRVAYPNNASIVSSLPGAVKQAISKSLPFIISVEESKSISSAIDKAIGAYNEYFRETGEKGNVTYMPVGDWLNTVDTLRGQTKKSGLTALEQELVKLFAEGKENQIEAQLRDYQQATVGTNGLFGSTPALSREDAVNKVFGVDYADKVVMGGGIARNNSQIQAVDDEIEKLKAARRNRKNDGLNKLSFAPFSDEDLIYCAKLAYLYAKKGYLTFADFVKQMFRDGNGDLAPYFKEAYQKLKDSDLNKEAKDGLSEDDEVNDTDISELEKTIQNEEERAKQILEASKRRTQELTALRVESATEFDGTNLAEGIDTRPALRYAYSDYIPNVPVSVEPNQYPFVNKYQLRAINLMLSAFKRGKPGFLLGDDTGTGKTATMLVTANEIALTTGKPVLIVTMNEMIATERFDADIAKINSKNPLNPVSKKNFTVTTYAKMSQYTGTQYAAIFFDESHKLANMDSKTNETYKKMKADYIVFASATPFQMPITSLYALSRLTGATEEQMARELGFEIGPDIYDPNKTGMLIPGGNANMVPFYLEYNKRLTELTKELIKDGLHIRRSYPFWGKSFEVNVSQVVPAHMTMMMNNVVQYFTDWIRSNYRRFEKKAINEQQLKLYNQMAGQARTKNSEHLTEMAKVNKFLFKEINDKLAAGRSVIIATEFKGEKAKDGKYYQEVEGINGKLQPKTQLMPTGLQLLKEHLVKSGIPFGEISGNVSDVIRKKAVKDFQANKIKVILMTKDSGGTGIDLDDQTGDHPRSMYVMSQGFSAMEMRQLMGRISRLTTKSASELHFLRIPGSYAEGRYQERTGMKHNILAALNDEVDSDMLGNDDYNLAKKVENVFKENKEAMARKNISNLADAIADWNQAKAQKMSVDQWEELIKKC